MATKYVSLGSIKRDGNEFSVKHKVTAAHKKAIDHVYVQWVFTSESAKEIKATVPTNAAALKNFEANSSNENRAASLNKSPSFTKVIDHTNESKNDGNDTVKVTRSKYYPNKSSQIKTVMARAIGRKGGKNVGAWSSWVTLTLSTPKKPSVTPDVDPSNGHIYFKVKTDHPKTGGKECYDVKYVYKRVDNIGGSTTYTNDTSKSDDFNTSTKDILYTNLQPGKYIRIECTATARGYAGVSTSVTSSHTFAKPNPPKITSAKLYGDKSTGTVIVSFSLDKNDDKAPVEHVQLMRLLSHVGTATEAANAPGWEDVAEEDGEVKGLQDSETTKNPVEPGTHVWYMVVAKNDELSTASQPFECKDLYLEKTTTTTGNVTLAVVGAGDGYVKLALTDSEADDDCIRVSWSSYEDAWTSTEQPDSFDVTWLEKTTQSGQQVAVADVYVRGLENGTRYWFRGQAVDKDSEGSEVLGGLSEAKTALPSSDTGTVSLYAPVNVGIGRDLSVSWEFTSDMAQEGADLLIGEQVAASVSGTATEGTIPAALLEPYAGSTVSVAVNVHAGGHPFKSAPVVVAVADPPTCEITVAQLTAQPLSFTVATNSPNSPSVTASVTSNGATGSGFDGDEPQLEGDCVWSGTLFPVWEETLGGYSATVSIPEGIKFWDGSEYSLTVTINDPATGLDSLPATEEFDVEWAHQADIPTGSVVASEDSLSATVTVDAPTGYVEGDRFDLYRITVDGDKRIAKDLPFGTVVTDRFAPFGKGSNLRYIAITRTPDGDWANSDDLEYELPGTALRFDWGNGESVELPFNIQDSAGYEKGYEEVVALDGSVVGWWDGSARRRSSLRTDLIKLQSADQEEAIASMAQHAGPVFVRTPSGAAFSANVVPSEVARNYSDRKVSVSLDCSEVALTSEHMPDPDDIIKPEWSGGSVYAIKGVVYDSQRWPLDDWTFLGYHGQTLYVTDSTPGTPLVRDGSGAEMVGYTWDGSVLLDANQEEVELTEEAQ